MKSVRLTLFALFLTIFTVLSAVGVSAQTIEPTDEYTQSGKTLTVDQTFADDESANNAFNVGAVFKFDITFTIKDSADISLTLTLGADDYIEDEHLYRGTVAIPANTTSYTVAKNSENVGGYHSYTEGTASGDTGTYDVTEQTFNVISYSYNGTDGYTRTVSQYTEADASSSDGVTSYKNGESWVATDKAEVTGENGEVSVKLDYSNVNGKYFLNSDVTTITKSTRKSNGDNYKSIEYMTLSAGAPINKNSVEYKYAERKRIGAWGLYTYYWDYNVDNKTNANNAVDGLLDGYTYTPITDSGKIKVDIVGGTDIDTDRYNKYNIYTNPINDYRHICEATPAGINILDSTASFSGSVTRKTAVYSPVIHDESGNNVDGALYGIYDKATGFPVSSPLAANETGYLLRLLEVPDGFMYPETYEWNLVFDTDTDSFNAEVLTDNTIVLPEGGGSAELTLTKTFDSATNADKFKARGLECIFDIFVIDSETAEKLYTSNETYTPSNGDKPGFFTLTYNLPDGTNTFEAVETTTDGIAASDGIYTSSPSDPSATTVTGNIEPPSLRYNYTEYALDDTVSSGVIKAEELDRVVESGKRYYYEDGKWNEARENGGIYYGHYSQFKVVEGEESILFFDVPYVKFADDKGNGTDKWYYTNLDISASDYNVKKNIEGAISAALDELRGKEDTNGNTYFICDGSNFHDSDTSRPQTVEAYTKRITRQFDTDNPITDNSVSAIFVNTVKLVPANVTVSLKSTLDIDGARITADELSLFNVKLYDSETNTEIDCEITPEFDAETSSIKFTLENAALEPNKSYYIKLDSRPDYYVSGDIVSTFTTDDTGRDFTAPDMSVAPTMLTINLFDNKENPLQGGKFEISEWHITGDLLHISIDKNPLEYVTDINGSLTAYKLTAGRFNYSLFDNNDIIIYRVKQTEVSDADIYDIDKNELLVYIDKNGKIAKAGYDGGDNGFTAVIDTIKNVWGIVQDGASEEPVIKFVNKIISGSVTVTLRDSEKKLEIDNYSFGYLPKGAKIALCDANGNLLTDFSDIFITDDMTGEFTDNGDGTYSLIDIRLPKDTDVVVNYKIVKYPDGYYADIDDTVYSVTLTRDYRDHTQTIDLDPIHVKFDKYGFESIKDDSDGEAIEGAQFVLLSADMELDREAIIALIRDIFDDLSLDGVSDAIQDFDFSQFDLSQLLQLLNSLTKIINISEDHDSLIPTILFAESDENGKVDFTNFILPTSYDFAGDGALADILDALGIDMTEFIKQITEKLGGLILDNIEIPDWLDGVTDLLLGQGADINIDQFIAPGEYLLYEIKTGVGVESGDDEYGRGFLIWRVTVNADGSTFIQPGKYSSALIGYLEPYEEIFGLTDGQISDALTPVQIDGRAYDTGTHFKMKNFIEKGLLILDAVDDETKLIIRNFLFENIDFDTLGKGELDDIDSLDELKEKLNEYMDGLGDYLISRVYEAEVEYKLYKQNDDGGYNLDAPLYLLHKNGYWYSSSDGESYDESEEGRFDMMLRRGTYVIVTETPPAGYTVIPNDNRILPGTDAVEFTIPNKYLDISQFINDDYYKYIPTSSFGIIPGNLVRIKYKAGAVAVAFITPLPFLEYDVGDPLDRSILVSDATDEALNLKAKFFVLYRNYKWKEIPFVEDNIILTDEELAALTETQGVKQLQPDGERYIPLTWTDEISGKVFDDEIFHDIFFNIWVYGKTTISIEQTQPIYYLDDFYSLGLYFNYFNIEKTGSRMLAIPTFYYDEECTQQIKFFDENDKLADPLPVGHYYLKVVVSRDDGLLPPDLDELWRGAEAVIGFDIKRRPVALQVNSITNGKEIYLPYDLDGLLYKEAVGEYLDSLRFSCTIRRMAVFDGKLIPFALPLPERATNVKGTFHVGVYNEAGKLVDLFTAPYEEGENTLSFTRGQNYKNFDGNGDGYDHYIVKTIYLPTEDSNYTQYGIEDILKIDGSYAQESELEQYFGSSYLAANYLIERRAQKLTLISDGIGSYDQDGDLLTVPLKNGSFNLGVVSDRQNDDDYDCTFNYELVSGSGIFVSPDGYVRLDGTGEFKVRASTVGSQTYQNASDELNIKVIDDSILANPFTIATFTRFHKVTATVTGEGSITNEGVSSVIDGSSLTFICTPDAGYKLVDVKIDGVSIGADVKFDLTNIISDRTVEVIFEPDNQKAANSLFSDVTGGDSFREPVEYLANHGIIKGVSDSEFGPYQTLTRGMFVTILGRYAQIDTTSYTDEVFDDVPLNAYYAPYIEWANDIGLVYGYGERRFGPEDTLTREQMITIVSRYAQLVGGKAINSVDIDYTDIDAISPWAVEAVKSCVANGYILADGKLRPRDLALRYEAAQIIYNYIMS